MGWEVGVDAEVRDDDTRIHLARKDVDGRAAVQKVEHHLRSDLTRVSADPFECHPMVRGECEDDAIGERRVEPSGHAGQAGR